MDDFVIKHRAVYGEGEDYTVVYEVFDLKNEDDTGTLYKTYELAEEHTNTVKRVCAS